MCLAVEANSRKILGFSVSRMPAKGRIAKKALEKYGYRKDERRGGWNHLFSQLQGSVSLEATFTSDSHVSYPFLVRKYFPKATHLQVKGQRGSSTGQGELKKIGYDPLFSLNHTCAMLRANINRLFRKTWCTTKKLSSLENHLAIYINYHNQVLTN